MSNSDSDFVLDDSLNESSDDLSLDEDEFDGSEEDDATESTIDYDHVMDGSGLPAKLVQRVPVTQKWVQELKQAKSRRKRYGVIEKIAKEGEKVGYSRLRRNKPRLRITITDRIVIDYTGVLLEGQRDIFDQVLVVDPNHVSRQCRMVVGADCGFQMITVKMCSSNEVQTMVKQLLDLGMGSERTSTGEDDIPITEKFQELVLQSRRNSTEAQKGSISDDYSYLETLNMDSVEDRPQVTLPNEEQEQSHVFQEMAPVHFPRNHTYDEIGQHNPTVADPAAVAFSRNAEGNEQFLHSQPPTPVYMNNEVEQQQHTLPSPAGASISWVSMPTITEDHTPLPPEVDETRCTFPEEIAANYAAIYRSRRAIDKFDWEKYLTELPRDYDSDDDTLSESDDSDYYEYHKPISTLKELPANRCLKLGWEIPHSQGENPLAQMPHPTPGPFRTFQMMPQPSPGPSGVHKLMPQPTQGPSRTIQQSNPRRRKYPFETDSLKLNSSQ